MPESKSKKKRTNKDKMSPVYMVMEYPQRVQQYILREPWDGGQVDSHVPEGKIQYQILLDRKFNNK